MFKKTLYLSILIPALLLVASSSCKNMLDLQPQNQYADEAVWHGEDAALIEAFVNNIYRGLGQAGIRVQLSTYVDETMLTFGWNTQNVTQSLITPSDYSRFNDAADQSSFYVWENVYKHIRSCNLFFEKIATSTSVTEAKRTSLTGEVHFLRAYLYQMLVQTYGGVPLIDKAYGLGDEYDVPRNSFEECINFIVSDCDKSAQMIGVTQKGRASKGGALALKSRVLLYAASDLHNSGANWAPGFANPELVGYVGGNRSARWQAAKEAAKAVMDLGTYSLHKGSPAAGEDVSMNYGNIFLLKETSEDIFVKFTLQSMNSTLVMPNLNNGPNGYHLRGANTPLGQFVDAFEMADGTRFDWTNPTHTAQPYKNREPRFYASILYDGAKWRQRPDDVISLDPVGVIQTGFTERLNSTTNAIDLIPGLDTRNSPIDDWNGTYSGYYIRKGIDPTVNAQFFNQETPWRFIRFTEVILNYAEACLELGLEAEARTHINQVRTRAGLPPIHAAGKELRTRYRNERRIELALEDHRFFDVRRWMIGPEAYTHAEGIKIVHKLNADKKTTTSQYTKVPSIQSRSWHNRFYFLPIKLEELNRNDKLLQNPLYN